MMVNENVARKNTWSRKLLLYTSISGITQIEQRNIMMTFLLISLLKTSYCGNENP